MVIMEKIFYYWAVKHYKEWEAITNGYKITLAQLSSFYNLLLEIKDAETALEKLPPYPLAEIDDLYFRDIELTKEYIKPLIDAGYEPLYYSGTMPA